MNKIIKKTVGKINILSIVSAVILVVAVVILAIFGYSTDAVNSDVNTLTVNVNQYAYTEYAEEIEDVCNDVFDELDLSYSYDMKGEMIGDESEIVYVFKKDVDLKTAVEKLNSAFDTATANDGALAGSIIRVTTNSEVALDRLPANGLLRVVISATVFAVLAGLYLTVRQNFVSGLTVIGSMLVSSALTCSLVILTRLPLTSSILYAITYNTFFVVIATTFSLNKINAKSKEKSDLDVEELVSENVAVKETLGFSIANAVALVLIGAIATSAVRNFALVAFVSLVAGTFSALIFAPALYLPLKRYADKKQAQRSRYDYKKGVSENKN